MKIIYKLGTSLAVIILLLFTIRVYSQIGLSVEPGVTVTDVNGDQIARTSHEYARARKNHKLNDDGGVIAFFKETNNDLLFSLSRNNVLHLTNFSTRASLGRWPLARWSHEYTLPEITQRLGQERAYEFVPKPKLTTVESGTIYKGCLSQNPLRYGDVDGNGSNEIVLLMNDDVVFFSIDQKKIIFQLRWNEDRSGNHEDSNGPIVKDPRDTTVWPQYRDPYVNGPMYAGLRGYAKLFLGEFNENNTRDIIVWYKLYQSNLQGEPPGFTKISDTLKHYELITTVTDGIEPTGEYLPMNTASTVIQQWLSTNDLTWQKGYPNTSECAGQTNQHIPEMIDPLLNDPDVLK